MRDVRPLQGPKTRSAWIAVAATVLAVLALAAGANPASASMGGGTADTARSSAPGALAPGWRGVMLRQVNALRAEAGIAPLQPCPSLRRAAQAYATVMASTGTFGHMGPDGTAPWDRMRVQGFRWVAAGENIAAGQRSVDEVMRAWKASPEHQANLLDPRMHQVGFGFATASHGGSTYWVQDFGQGTGC
jgi:uncharacterized protein YkwD